MKLSIITVNYNNASGLKKTLESVGKQTWREFEEIVIDGNSSDDSLDVARLFENIIKNFSVSSEPDDGVYDAMNKGIKKAKGEYVIFMNSGDYFVDDKVLAEVIPFLDGTEIIAGQAMEEKTEMMLKSPKYLLPRFVLKQNICHQAEFINRNLFQRIGLYSVDYKVLADWEFNLKAACQLASYKTIDRLVAIVEPEGLSNRLIQEMEEEKKRIKKDCLSLGVEVDYQVWMNHKTYAHPALGWAIKKGWPLNLLKLVYKLLG